MRFIALINFIIFTDQTRLGVWILDGDLHHRSLLRYSLTKDSLPHTLVMLVVSMAQPWKIVDSLQRWSDVISTHIDRLKLDSQQRHELEQQRKCHLSSKLSLLRLEFYIFIMLIIIEIA